MLELQTQVKYVKGVGPRIAEMLAEKGITTVEDLLYYLPFRYEDRINPRRIAQLRSGEMASLVAEVRTSGLFRTSRSNIPMFQLTVADPGGRVPLKCVFFHGSHLKDKFAPGQVLALYGKVEWDHFGRSGLQMVNPQIEILRGDPEDPEAAAAESLEIGRIVPVYESAGHGKLSSRWFRRIIHGALENLTPEVPDAIPEAIRRRLGLMPRRDAMWQAHWPDPGERFEDLQNSRTPAHKRLIFEELFFLELGLELKHRRLKAQPGIGFEINDRVREAIRKILPFHPTAAQKRVMKEIAEDMQRPEPMRRLLQGDVGSGKTIVAFQAASIAIENGYQVALMAPTEILAQQHFLSARRILENAGYYVVLLTGSLEDDRKRDVRRHIMRGNAQLIIGTHALIQETVEFARLGLVIVDEQHRFGVMQRFRLMKKPQAVAEPAQEARPSAAKAALSAASVGTAEAVPLRKKGARASAAAEERQPTVEKQGLLAAPVNSCPDTKPGSTDLAAAQAEGNPPEPDTLVMTATPIPRTLALTLYGDLDVSVIDELPPGRTPIVTRRVNEDRVKDVWEFVRKQVNAGHQAYVVYPVIEEQSEEEVAAESRSTPPCLSKGGRDKGRSPAKSGGGNGGASTAKVTSAKKTAAKTVRGKKSTAPKQQGLWSGLKAAVQMYDELRQSVFPEFRVGLLHGKLDPEEKEVVMRRFQRGEIHVLVATTVIEVGVDVPNANVMVIEHADRFGLSQLHQLRGRIGRGAAKSFCILTTSGKVSQEGDVRLDAMVRTTNGFEISEMDLELRGPGEFFGTRQAGMPDLRVSNIVRDREILQLAKQEAAVVTAGPTEELSAEEISRAMVHLRSHWQRRYGLVEVG
jgi:RecG-like helicase